MGSLLVLLSHPSRVRELKRQELSRRDIADLSHPSRVRELKLSKSGEYLQTEAVSHPSRVRELKLRWLVLAN